MMIGVGLSVIVLGGLLLIGLLGPLGGAMALQRNQVLQGRPAAVRQLLDERLARGEIDVAQYRELLVAMGEGRNA